MDVLIVDDDPLLRELLSAAVRKAVSGAEVVAVSDLEAAFQRLAHFAPPDLALLDLGLPGHAGLDSLKRFRWKFPDVRVVVVSANEDEKTVRVALDAGAAAYIPKSAKPEAIVAALARAAR